VFCALKSNKILILKAFVLERTFDEGESLGGRLDGLGGLERSPWEKSLGGELIRDP